MRTLPILTFDERVLSPRFGYVFQRTWLDPYESIVGMLWKFARMNRLAGHAVVSQLSRHPIDPYEGIEPTTRDVDARRVARLLGVAQRTVRTALYTPASDSSPHFRYCVRCLARGYHGVVQQLERNRKCSVHGHRLEEVCRHCGRTSEYRLDAQLLDAPFRCRHCRSLYASAAPNLTQRAPLGLKARVALTRAVLA